MLRAGWGAESRDASPPCQRSIPHRTRGWSDTLDTPRDRSNNRPALFTRATSRTRIEDAVITEHSRFQLEASKLSRDVVFQVTVFQKEERRRKRLFAATQCSDPFHFLIQFIIREAPDFDTLLARFVSQLQHRGFEPNRIRMRQGGRWASWTPVPHASGPKTQETAAAAAAELSAAPKKKKKRASAK